MNSKIKQAKTNFDRGSLDDRSKDCAWEMFQVNTMSFKKSPEHPGMNGIDQGVGVTRTGCTFRMTCPYFLPT